MLSTFSRGVPGIERSAVRIVLTALQDPSEDSDLISLSSSLLQLASSDGLSCPIIIPHYVSPFVYTVQPKNARQ